MASSVGMEISWNFLSLSISYLDSIKSRLSYWIIRCSASGEFLMFILKWFLIDFALVANFKVERVSSKLLEWLEHVTSSDVLKLPPKLS
jgi:hypothetical protein